MCGIHSVCGSCAALVFYYYYNYFLYERSGIANFRMKLATIVIVKWLLKFNWNEINATDYFRIYTCRLYEMAENGIWTRNIRRKIYAVTVCERLCVCVCVFLCVCVRLYICMTVCVLVLVYYRIYVTNKTFILWEGDAGSNVSIVVVDFTVCIEVLCFFLCCLLFFKNACERKSTIVSLCWVNTTHECYLL